MLAHHVEIYTDGSSRGNPGPGGYGAVLIFLQGEKQITKELSAGFAHTTNNRMELMAVISALEELNQPCDVTIHSDSQYVVNAHQQNWLTNWQAHNWKNSSKKPVKNADLWQRLLIAERPHQVRFEWVKGHAGNEWNERCDELATAAADACIAEQA